jgi:hypothetical protein
MGHKFAVTLGNVNSSSPPGSTEEESFTAALQLIVCARA